MTSVIVEGFATRKISALSGVPMSTLHYWVATGLVVPSIRGSEGKRATRWWSLANLVAVRAIKTLRDAGCPLQTIRRAQSVIDASWHETSADAFLYWDGVDLLQVGFIGEIHSTVQHPGQGVFHLVAMPVGAWRLEAADMAVEIDLNHLAELRAARAERAKTAVTPAVRTP